MSAHPDFPLDTPSASYSPPNRDKHQPSFFTHLAELLHLTTAWGWFQDQIKQLKQDHLLPKNITPAMVAGVFGVFLLLMGGFAATVGVQQTQDIRQQASVAGPPPGGE